MWYNNRNNIKYFYIIIKYFLDFIINDNISLHQSKEEISIENKELNEEVQENDGENDGENDVINDLNIIHNTTGGSSSNNNTLVQISGGEEGVSLNLMTPEAFSSPGKRESSSDVLVSIFNHNN